MLFLNFGQIQEYRVWLDLGDLLSPGEVEGGF